MVCCRPSKLISSTETRPVLAPMVRSGELPSRLLALHYGADLVWGPETIDRAMIGTTRRVNTALNTIDFTRLPSNGHKNPNSEQKESLIYRIHPEREGSRLVFQIGTSDPDRAVQAARLVAADVAGIDVNAGCPKPFSMLGGMGAQLLQTPDKLCTILAALVKDVAAEFEIGISVKIRLLETAERTESLVRKLCATGITGLTVHCRTTPMRPRERAIREQLKMIAGICRENGVACLMNGDVENREQAEELITEFGVDGAMIATAAEKNPSCFRTKEEEELAPPKEIVERYVKTALEVENRFGNTKFLLGNMIPGKMPLYRQIVRSKSYEQVCNIWGFEHLVDRAKEVDQSLGINSDEQQGRKGRKNKTALAAGGNQAKIRSMENDTRKSLSERGPVQQQAMIASGV